GDVDGDGVPEVIAGGTAISGSKLWAFRVDGAILPGFPVAPASAGMSAVALGPVDAGLPGEQIAFTDGTGALHLVTSAGEEHPGYPTPGAANGRAPVVARLGGPGSAAGVVLASAGQVTAHAADGATVWSAPLAGSPVQDPVLADLDGGGRDEVIVATTNPTAIAVLNAGGAPVIARAGRPRETLPPAQGPLVVGPLAAEHGPCVAYFQQSGGLVAFDEVADSIAAFPKPGGAGLAPSLDELDGDGATEVAAGTAPADSNVYTYDAGALTWSPAVIQWPTPRGDMGRAASHAAGVPPPLLIDRIRPARVQDLEAHALDDSTVQVSFHTTGDDSLTGQAADVLLRRATFPLDEQNFDQGIFVPVPPIGPPGTRVTLDLTALPEGSTWWFAMKVRDAAGNLSAVSNADSAALPGLAPAAITDLRVLQVRSSSVSLVWTATGEDGNVGRPQGYLVSASPAPLDSANVDAAPIQRRAPALYEAGQGE